MEGLPYPCRSWDAGFLLVSALAYENGSPWFSLVFGSRGYCSDTPSQGQTHDSKRLGFFLDLKVQPAKKLTKRRNKMLSKEISSLGLLLLSSMLIFYWSNVVYISGVIRSKAEQLFYFNSAKFNSHPRSCKKIVVGRSSFPLNMLPFWGDIRSFSGW